MLKRGIAPLAVFTCLVLLTTARAADPPALAAWPGIFPEFMGYARTFETPVAAEKTTPDRTKASGTQKAIYEWTGGSIRHLELTLGVWSKLPEAGRGAEKVQLHRTEAWYSEKMKENMSAFTLLVPLGDGKGIVLEGYGLLGGKQGVLALAGKLNLERIRTALAKTPRTDFRRSLETFRAVTKEMSYRDLTSWAGDADADIGSGIHAMVWKLPDGGRVLVGTPDFMKVLYIKHETKDGKKEDLLK
jgi:hypothetical protein